MSKERAQLGFATMDAKLGDRIVLLEGGKVPYILRPKTGKKNLDAMNLLVMLTFTGSCMGRSATLNFWRR